MYSFIQIDNPGEMKDVYIYLKNVTDKKRVSYFIYTF